LIFAARFSLLPGHVLSDHTISASSSSSDVKLSYVYKGRLTFKYFFDVLITANQISLSTPDPQCYLQATEALGVRREGCFAFEDSFAGLETACKAQTQVMGLVTTNSLAALESCTNHSSHHNSFFISHVQLPFSQTSFLNYFDFLP
jgi:beta-phosphoglucomutase-like phosphatase (HAD superfamily)